MHARIVPLHQDVAFRRVDPVGRWLQIAPNGSENRFAEVVGVVEHVILHEPSKPPLPQIFRAGGSLRPKIVVRTDRDATTAVTAFREEMASLDPEVAVGEVAPLATLVRVATAPARLRATLMSAFGGIALFLAGVGIYGVIGSEVAQRHRELGIRVALGATPRAIRSLVVGQGVHLIVLGLTIGVLGAATLARVLGGLLYGIEPWDPTSYAIAGALLAAVACTATWIPARRAARVDPLVALRKD